MLCIFQQSEILAKNKNKIVTWALHVKAAHQRL